ncbi:oxygen-independent coproporphyrinogen III oxidase [Halorhodospira halochloris]|uniref:Coproporphyrinogen-III oxidase n=1 Tax=Halorhodospira halochloris TaxID=1052 RepID=A0A0X8X9K7_HALHR|nr:oxygen-independent coproporphyrinogen III oxidase [Halorhodospira halochloris]MBK1652069.1 oxygen-independent coproporphyrinogen III oxidase [Halorhodospira halochloris]MCG5530751.1 oxygen-independent coproporphyrinogen III oxidase [Halorhodospira halochloris]MCG5549017.1 oxygen-independent coproporphyrinogen III oxidase [Halorhodospira halochloris]BAU57991.1 coproporphyrinogen III oxidase [Halorhodospira halochloris]
MEQRLQFDRDLLRRYDVSGPRYTSYPTAPQFHEDFDDQSYAAAARASNEVPNPKPLSVYMHVPFCSNVCFYCACNKIVTANYRHAEEYLEHVFREIAMQSELFDDNRRVEQLHLGGGTPNYLRDEDIARLVQNLREHFNLEESDKREFSIEIDPRDFHLESVSRLAELGFNRMSVGVQDLNSTVQKAVNREQSPELCRSIIEEGRRYGFRSTNVDLIYGLPKQTAESFEQTLDEIIDIRPERLAIYNYAHLPHLFKIQKQIKEDDLPGPEEKLTLFGRTIEKLTDAGYVFIGMDHFALPEDELAKSQKQGTLHRNFQGYSTRADCDLIALGSTSIGKIGPTYSQNLREPEDYKERIANGRLAVFRGLELSAEDLLRREVIIELMCHSQLQFAEVEKKHGIDFKDHFAAEIERLEPLVDDGLVDINSERIQVLPRGRLMLRHVAMAFDAYLEREATQGKRYSKVL